MNTNSSLRNTKNQNADTIKNCNRMSFLNYMFCNRLFIAEWTWLFTNCNWTSWHQKSWKESDDKSGRRPWHRQDPSHLSLEKWRHQWWLITPVWECAVTARIYRRIHNTNSVLRLHIFLADKNKLAFWDQKQTKLVQYFPYCNMQWQFFQTTVLALSHFSHLFRPISDNSDPKQT